MLLGLLGCARPAAAGLLAQLETEIQKITADRSQSVVTVRAVHVNEVQSELREVYVGTGVVFDSGWILTTPSVVASGVAYSVQAPGQVPVPAELIGYHTDGQTAVFRAPSLRAPPAPFARDTLLMPGQLLLVLGNAYGVEGAVSWGVAAGDREDGFWQLGVNVSPGASGSPVLNVAGEVVGIIVAAVSGREQPDIFSGSVALMVPGGRCMPLARRMVREGSIGRAFLGIRPESLNSQTARALGLTHGVLIGAVSFGSPAYGAGLQAGDIIIEMEGLPMPHEQALRTALAERCPGEELELTVVRDQRLNRVSVRLGQVPELLPERPVAHAYSMGASTAARAEPVDDSTHLQGQISELEKRLAELKDQLKQP